MVALRNHGGSCCGALHIHGFTGDARAQDFAELHEHTASRDPCLHEVILNVTQCNNNPRLLAKLAELGYVLTTGFVNGNHDSSVYVFHRAGQRLALNDLTFEWNGQIASPSLRGRLPRLPTHPTRNQPVALQGVGRYVDARLIRRGDKFTYVNPSNRLNGEVLTYESDANAHSYDGNITLRHEPSGLLYRRSVNMLVWLSQAAYVNPQPARAAPAIPAQLHRLDDNDGVAVAPERFEVYRSYHNVFRDGRVGPGYPDMEAARNGAPRVAQRQIQVVYSDGSIETEVPL